MLCARARISGVHPSNTVEIGKLVIERNLRTRRKMVVEEETEIAEVKHVCCEICSKDAEFEAFMAPLKGSREQRSAFYCRRHLDKRLKHCRGPGAIIGYKPLTGAV